MIRTLPRDFVLGATSAAYQVEGGLHEGGRIPAAWDSWLQRPSNLFDAEIASDSYHRWREDIENCRQYGIKSLQISFAWTRLQDEEGQANPEGLKFYDAVIDACLEADIEPYVALYQFDLPADLADRGGWLDPLTTERYLAYAKLCFTHFGDRVHHWLTFKDPVTESFHTHITGLFPPGNYFAPEDALHQLYRMTVAHSRAVMLYKGMYPGGKIGIAHRAEPVYPLQDTEADRRAAWLDDAFSNHFLLDLVLDGRSREDTQQAINTVLVPQRNGYFMQDPQEASFLQVAASSLDFLGVNYYASHFTTAWQGGNVIHHNGAGEKGTTTYALAGIGRRVARSEIPTTDWDWSIFPQGLYDMLMRIHREYPAKPILITENGLGMHEELEKGTVEDDDRIDYLRQHISAVLDAIEDGVDVRGFFIWSLVDCMSWTNGYEKRYGLFYVDRADGRRYAKKSAHWLRDFSKRRIMLTLSGLGTAFHADPDADATMDSEGAQQGIQG